MDRMRWAGRVASLLALAAAAVALSATSAGAAGRFTSCGKNPNRLTWNLQERGSSCKAARQLAYHGERGKAKKVRKHVYQFTTPTDWNCFYTVFHSNHAQDSEGEIFDCRKAGAVVRWSDSPAIQPHSLR